jgi:hypothetical protein
MVGAGERRRLSEGKGRKCLSDRSEGKGRREVVRLADDDVRVSEGPASEAGKDSLSKVELTSIDGRRGG